ncbi:MAG: RDD family protein [Terracidiphilus sp.]
MEPIGDQLNIETPELVAIEMPLAGIGSRFIGILVDSLIMGAAFVILILLAAMLLPALSFFGDASANWVVGIFVLILFLLQWGYFALFEAFANGRTPGKRVARIRVIHQSGRGITFVEALGRNLVRFVDYLPSFYAIGVVTMFVTRRHQRLGDLVAGTLVVHDREADSPAWSANTSRTFTAPAFAPPSGAGLSIAPPGFPRTGLGPWGGQPVSLQTGPGLWGGPPHLRVLLPAPALARLSTSDLVVLEGFFARRLDMDLSTRAALAARIASALCAKSGLAIPPDVSVETFLEAVAHQFREMGRMS